MSSSSSMADLGEPALGVAHGRRRIAVDRAEIALPVDQRQAHGEILRHAHQRVVDRLVAVRVILAHHVADDARRLDVFLVGRVALLVHRIEDAPVHGLQPVAHVRQRARHDHAHRVIEVVALHLLRDRNGADVGRVIALRLVDHQCRPRKFLRDLCPICLADSARRTTAKGAEMGLFLIQMVIQILIVKALRRRRRRRDAVEPVIPGSSHARPRNEGSTYAMAPDLRAMR